jgi:hypothetical protein
MPKFSVLPSINTLLGIFLTLIPVRTPNVFPLSKKISFLCGFPPVVMVSKLKYALEK